MTPNELTQKINESLSFLQAQGISLVINRQVNRNGLVSWASFRSGIIPKSLGGSATVEWYLDLVETNQYSALLNDGGLLQLAYRIQDRRVVWHRLCFMPCPLIVPTSELAGPDAMIDVLTSHLGDPLKGVLLKSPIRIDYDPVASGRTHPSAHITLNSDTCRIACLAPFDPSQFIEFVIRHFYPRTAAAYPDWCETAARQRVLNQTIQPEESESIHINWRLNLEPDMENAW